jgi:hypothetical protein
MRAPKPTQDSVDSDTDPGALTNEGMELTPPGKPAPPESARGAEPTHQCHWRITTVEREGRRMPAACARCDDWIGLRRLTDLQRCRLLQHWGGGGAGRLLWAGCRWHAGAVLSAAGLSAACLAGAELRWLHGGDSADQKHHLLRD